MISAWVLCWVFAGQTVCSMQRYSTKAECERKMVERGWCAPSQ